MEPEMIPAELARARRKMIELGCRFDQASEVFGRPDTDLERRYERSWRWYTRLAAHAVTHGIAA